MIDQAQIDRLRGTRLVRRADVAALLAAYEAALADLAKAEEDLDSATTSLASMADAMGVSGASPTSIVEAIVELRRQISVWMTTLQERGED